MYYTNLGKEPQSLKDCVLKDTVVNNNMSKTKNSLR